MDIVKVHRETEALKTTVQLLCESRQEVTDHMRTTVILEVVSYAKLVAFSMPVKNEGYQDNTPRSISGSEVKVQDSIDVQLLEDTDTNLLPSEITNSS